MRKKSPYKLFQGISLLIAFILICGMLPLQTIAAETRSDARPSQTASLTKSTEKVCTVAFDPDDGKTTYPDFFKITVPINSKVTSKPQDPTRDGYIFKGWFAYLDEQNEPVLWNFDTNTVVENTTLWAAWEKGCIVAFDPDDGKTAYPDFFKITVPINSKVTSKPQDPTRDGYIFKGWFAYLNEHNEPVLWNFDTNTVVENTTLWAAWEKGCIVAFDPDDGKTAYPDFFKITVPINSKVTSKPQDPTRDGYIFKGWFAYLAEHNEPVLWNFDTNTVVENTTLWAAWEEGCIVAFDPDDGKTTYPDFFKATFPIGSKVTSKPQDPVRDGYIFKGWYSYLDENNNPVFWNFDTDIVIVNTTLWAAWEEDSENGGSEENNGNNNGNENNENGNNENGNNGNGEEEGGSESVPQTGDSNAWMIPALTGTLAALGLVVLGSYRKKRLPG